MAALKDLSEIGACHLVYSKSYLKGRCEEQVVLPILSESGESCDGFDWQLRYWASQSFLQSC